MIFQNLLKNLSKPYKPYWVGFFIVVMVYIACYGCLLWFTDGLPYVIDNNESFSSLVHAYNLYHWDLSKSFGLTDETFNPFSQAHPVIHTHQGNWPRIFSFLIYLLGARSIESQIIITTFSIGLISIWFIYHYFSKIVTVFFASLASIILMTDYIMFAEWQVVTYRVWHGFFVFSSLLCVHGGIDGEKRKFWLFLTILNFACLFYWELVFAVFVSLWSALYAIILFFRKYPKKVILWGCCQFSGAMLAISILMTQLTAFMGWHNTLKDFKLTLLARNATSQPDIFRQELKQFYDNINIAFFYNMQDGARYRSFSCFFQSFFKEGFQVYSPIFTLNILILFLLLLYKNLNFQGQLDRIFVDLTWNSKLAIIFLMIPLYIFLITIVNSNSFLGVMGSLSDISLSQLNFSILILPLIAFSLSWFIVNTSGLRTFEYRTELPFNRLFLVGLFMVWISLFVDNQFLLYDKSLKELWSGAIVNVYPSVVWRALLVSLICITSILWLSKEKINLKKESNSQQRNIVLFLLAGFMAYTICYLLSPGYIFSGYLNRYAPFHVFLISVIISLSLYTLFQAFLHGLKLSFTYKNFPIQRFTFCNHIFVFLCFSGFSLILIHWFFIQYQYIHLLPPTVFNFVKMLKNPELQGKSSVSNTYAQPFAIQANSWSYNDPSIASGKVRVNEQGYSFTHDFQYLWFADKKTNLSYKWPDLFICFVSQDLKTALLRYQNPNIRLNMCSNYNIVKQTLFLERNSLGHTLIKMDETNNDMWAIVKIGNNFPSNLAK